MSNDKLTFTRNTDGSFNFAESRLERLTAELFDRASEPRIPQSLMQAASRELITAIHRVADTRGVAFGTAATALIRERPALFRLTRGLAVPDSDRNADVEIDGR